MKALSLIAAGLLLGGCLDTTAQTKNGPPVSQVWVADNGDGTYKNPILHADYSDPDAIRVGDDYYMTASSFNQIPGLPLLHSKDLVNWRLIGYALNRQPPFEIFDQPQPGNGVWAPALRFHNGEFYLYYPDPDRGIYLVKAKNPAGPWSEPLLVKAGKGWIDPCPLWDADGKAYLVNAMARSRAGFKNILVISEMSPDGTKLLDEGTIVFDGHDQHQTVEGPKLYQRNGYYYIFAPAGGVREGWQLVLRAKNIYGPYETKTVLAQGPTVINGPHQGAWVETQTGESWFLHFQDRDAFGRIVHLQPLRWEQDWPVLGDGGKPVLRHKKPNVGKTYPIITPPDSDEFNAPKLGLQWQWNANFQTNWAFSAGPAYGFLRLFNKPLPADFKNFQSVPNLLTQKFPAPQFTATTKVTFTARTDDEKTGLIVMGLDYAYLSVRKKGDGLFISHTICRDTLKGTPETTGPETALAGNTFYLRVKITPDARAQFSYSIDGTNFSAIGTPFEAKAGRWIGAKVGIFAVRTGPTYETGQADFDWFRIE